MLRRMGATRDTDEPWPRDDHVLPKKVNKTRSVFKRRFERRAPYTEGDGKMEFAVFAWSHGEAPTQIERSSKLSVVDVAVGPRHTVFTTRDGVAYACGDGSHGQLGSKRLDAVARERREPTSLEKFLVSEGQRRLAQYPTKIFPTGILEKNGKDARVAQVCATLTATYCREMNEMEATGGLENLVEELRRIESELPFDSTVTLGRLRAALVEKCAQMRRLCKGRVFAWGDTCGGLTTVIAPTRLRNIEKVTAGRRHVLALGSRQLFSWGSGRDGRLGHDDYLDRVEPTVVEFFTRPPRLIAAGDAHSLAVVGECDIFTWGRGAHGRLGLGRHMNKRLPNLVDIRQNNSCRIVDAALGGAHSVVLAEEIIDPGLVNPWGSRRRMYSWGFGANGELGNDKVQHCSLPQLVKMPKWEIAVSVAAGRHHTIALTVHGDVYAWGNGRIAPYRVESKAQFLKVSAGDSRTVGIALRHRALDKRQIERGPISVLPSLLANQRRRNCCPEWRCVRSWPVVDEQSPKNLRCETCHVESVCVWCARLCHAGHRLSPGGEDVCRCGLTLTCRRPPPVSEWLEDPNIEASVVRLQKFGRRVVAAKLLTALKTAMTRSRTIASTKTWHLLAGEVWKKARDSCARKSERVERSAMAVADSFSLASRRYFKLQLCLQSIEAQKGALRRLCAKTGAPDPLSSSSTELLRFRSVRALRQWHRRHDHPIRLPHDQLRLWAAKYDVYPVSEDPGRVPDPDMSLFALRARDESMHGENTQRHRRASLAAPEKLYARVRTLRQAHVSRLASRRRRSLDPQHLLLGEENEDSTLCNYREGVKDSLDLMRKVVFDTTRQEEAASSDDEEGRVLFFVRAEFHSTGSRIKKRQQCPSIELRQQIPGRSRSVGAPERLAETKRLCDLLN